MVWRPLVARFTPDPDLIYWVPPLYNSHFIRIHESRAMDSQRMPSERMNDCEGSSQAEQEYQNNPCQPNSQIMKDIVCYEQEKTPKARFKTNRTILSSSPQNSYELFSAQRARVGSVDSVTLSIYKDERQQESVRMRSRSVSFSPKNLKELSKNLRRMYSSMHSEYTSRDNNTKDLDSFAGHNLDTFDFSQIRKTEWAAFQGEDVSFLEELRPDKQTLDSRGKQQRKRLYFIAAFFLLLLGIVAVIVVVFTYKLR
ncbi:uncharacterized protein [Procambarus clarkii]|nr:uncharacterized protein LOC123746760 isoform X2 [Procambarus clarkii]